MKDTKKSTPKKLSRLQYFEWTLSIERLNHAKTTSRLANTEALLQEQRVRAEGLLHQIVKTKALSVLGGVELAEQAYEDEKIQLEKKLGIPLSGKIINENLEILDEKDL